VHLWGGGGSGVGDRVRVIGWWWWWWNGGGNVEGGGVLGAGSGMVVEIFVWYCELITISKIFYATSYADNIV